MKTSAKTRVAVIGSGNIGTDLMIKVIRLSQVLGSNGLDLKRCVEELNELPLRDASKERILRQNAIELLGL